MMRSGCVILGRLKSTGFMMLDSIVKRGRSRGTGAVRGGVELLSGWGRD